MKSLHFAAIAAVLGMSLLVGCSDPEAPAAEVPVSAKFEYVADMTGIT